MRIVGEVVLIFLSGMLLPAGCFAFFKLIRLAQDRHQDDARPEREKLDRQ